MKVVAGMDIGKTSLDGSVSAGPGRRFENPRGRCGFPMPRRLAKATDREGLRQRKPLVQQRVQVSVGKELSVESGVFRH